MKVLLIDPPYSSLEIGGSKKNFKYALNIIPSLGLAYIGSIAEKLGHIVKIIDATLGISNNEILKIALEFSPNIVGLTSTTPTFRSSINIASLIRDVLPNTILISGGPHSTACPEEVLDYNLFDFVVLGEGEETFKELIYYLDDKSKKKLDAIKGIAFKKNNNFIITKSRPNISDLDSLPNPARHLLPSLRLYNPTPASCRRLPLATVITSRGCPHKCTFCSRSVFGEIFRARSVANIISEVKDLIYRYGVSEIRFFDDTFTIDKYRVEKICKEMKKLRSKVVWTCLTGVNHVDKSILRLMKDSGCWQVLFGLESGDDYILEKLGKKNTVKDNIRAVVEAYSFGLRVRADFLVGSPWETKESLRKTINFAKKLPLDFAHFNKFVPYPGTELYKQLIDQGYSFNFDDTSFINNQTDSMYVPPAFSKLEYIELLNSAYKEFYLRWKYVLNKMIAIRSFTEFSGNIKGAVSIISL